MMRHFCLPHPVAALARGVGMAAARARLIALSDRAQGTGSGDLGTAAGAVARAAVAAAADEYRCAAAGTEVASSWRFHRREGPMRARQVRAMGEILSTHRRPPGHGARHRYRTCRFGAAVAPASIGWPSSSAFDLRPLPRRPAAVPPDLLPTFPNRHAAARQSSPDAESGFNSPQNYPPMPPLPPDSRRFGWPLEPPP